MTITEEKTMRGTEKLNSKLEGIIPSSSSISESYDSFLRL